ncbi:MAG: hypothetical protein QXH80_04530 [Candidatus Nanoarchaeia archaeon]
MDKKYKILLVILFVALIAFSGCAKKQKTEAIPAAAAFVGGSDGIKISLLPGQPQSPVYENQQFQIGVQIENKGEGEVTPPIWLSVSGINVDSFKLDPAPPVSIATSLMPVRKTGNTIIPGGQTQKMFKAKAPEIVGAEQQFPLRVAAIYNYASKAVAAACIKEDLYQQTTGGTEICKLTGSKTVASAGAPIKVTSVEENPSGFQIKIKNVGGGYPFKYATFPTTEGAINQYEDKNWVTIKSITLGKTELKDNCGQTEVYLVNNEAQIFCTADLQAQTEYVEQLTIELSYGYVSTVSTTLNVQGILGGTPQEES